VGEKWRLQDASTFVGGQAAASLVADRIEAGAYETWFESTTGRMLALVTNADRALVMLLRGEGDPGEHLVEPGASDAQSSGFVLANGQIDSYSTRDTVPLSLAIEVLASVIDGRTHPAADWKDDR
jgi:hypothetical protein